MHIFFIYRYTDIFRERVRVRERERGRPYYKAKVRNRNVLWLGRLEICELIVVGVREVMLRKV